jgi:hypothetical protein
VRKGISETVAMLLSGHKTMSVSRRYDITSTDDIKDGGRGSRACRWLERPAGGGRTGCTAS